jgi:hypothetical protein
LSRVATKRVHKCFYRFPAFAIRTVSAPCRGEGYPVFSVTKMSCGQRVYRPYTSEEFESRNFRRPRSASQSFSSSAICCKLMTDNLHVDSRRCASIYPQITASPTAPEATPHLGFRDTCHCGASRACYFFIASGLPANSVRGDYSNSSRMRTRDCRWTVSARPNTGEEFEAICRRLNFVTSVRW